MTEEAKRKAYIAPDLILKMFINPGRREFEIYKKADIITSSFGLFEAIMSIQEEDQLNMDAVIFFLANTKIDGFIDEGVPFKISDQRIQTIRERAMA